MLAARRVALLYGNKFQHKALSTTSTLHLPWKGKEGQPGKLQGRFRDFFALPLLPNNQESFSLVRDFLSKWNYDFEPGPFPQEMTEKQRKVLAEKYNLEPEDYKPVDPKLGLWTGDFPDVPYLGHGTRSPWEDWDQPEARRNYMEPCRYNYDYFRRFDPGYEYKTNVSHKTAVGVLILIPSVLFALHFYTKDVSIRPALKPTQFPYNYKDIKLGNVEGVKQNVHGDFHVESPHH